MHTIWWNTINNSYALNNVNEVKDFEEDKTLQNAWRFVTTINSSSFDKLIEDFVVITKTHKETINRILAQPEQ